MAKDEFDIPSADDLAARIEKEKKEHKKLASSTIDTYLSAAATNDEWPAKIPVAEIPESVRDETYEYLENQKYDVTKGAEYWLIQKPEK
jgi:hypothetical protein